MLSNLVLEHRPSRYYINVIVIGGGWWVTSEDKVMIIIERVWDPANRAHRPLPVGLLTAKVVPFNTENIWMNDSFLPPGSIRFQSKIRAQTLIPLLRIRLLWSPTINRERLIAEDVKEIFR